MFLVAQQIGNCTPACISLMGGKIEVIMKYVMNTKNALLEILNAE